MANKNKALLILGVILMIMAISAQDKKEAVIQEKIVSPGQSMPIIGELWVKETAIAWLPAEAAKVHWYICSDSVCNTIINQGYEALTADETISLNSKLTSQFKGATYGITLTAPITPGFYWYQGVAETANNYQVVSIYPDVGTSISAQKFEVIQGVIVPCGTDQTIEPVSIQNGIIRVTVQIKYSGNQPACIEQSRTDSAFEVICDSGYSANVNGRQSTCSLACTDTSWNPDTLTYCTGTSFTQTSNCDITRTAIGTKTEGCTGPSTFEYRCTTNNIYQVIDSNLHLLTTCSNGQVCGDAGVAKQREVSSTTELSLAWLTGVNGGMCTSKPGTGNWSPSLLSKACGEAFNQINSNSGASRAAIGTACESGTCNTETAKCEEEEESDFSKWIPYIIIFFAAIIGIKMLGKQK